MLTLIRKIQFRYSRGDKERGGPLLEAAVVFGVVALIAVAVYTMVDTSVKDEIANYVDTKVSEALGDDTGGTGDETGWEDADCSIVPPQDREACQEAQDG